MNIKEEIKTSVASLKVNSSNEAETRRKIIDQILEKILGWNVLDICYEEKVQEDGITKYADYIIKNANSSMLIEAKRISIRFQLPKNTLSKLNSTLVKDEIGDAIIQARDYCRKMGIPFAIVTNGDQWIIFPASRIDGVSFSESSAIIFHNIDDALNERFDYFYKLLSREGFIDENLKIELIGRSEDQIEIRRLNKIFAGTTNQTNPVFPLIDKEVTVAFSDSLINENPELLEKCYVSTNDRQKFDQKIQMHLQKKESLFSKSLRPMRSKESNSFREKIKASTNLNRPLAILILGSVGSGKTTFIEYTHKISAKEFFNEKLPNPPQWIKIDFRNFSQNQIPLDFIYNNIFQTITETENHILNSYEKVVSKAYKQEIDSLKKGPLFLIANSPDKLQEKISEKIYADYENKIAYIDKILKYYTQISPVFVVIDNVDQFESDTIQSDIFSDAIAFAGKLNINLIIAMRESTYVNHRSSPTFDAFDFDPILIEPPPIPSVISKRFNLTEQLLERKKGAFKTLNGANFEVNNLADFIRLTKSSVLGTEIGNRIDVLSNHDVRLALRMTREFLSNGYTDPGKAINFYQSGKEYRLPVHEAFRSILLGNRSVYDENYSVIGNPLDSKLNQNNSELLRLFILAALVKQHSTTGSEFITASDIAYNLTQIGFKEEITLSVLTSLCSLRFIHTRSHKNADMTSSFYPSRLGGHVIKILLGDLTFIENILMDTFISNKEVWDHMKRLSTTISSERDIIHKLELRIERAKCFYNYMENLYEPLLIEANHRKLDPIWLTHPLKEQKDGFYSNCEYAMQSAIRNYPKK
ncbi:hypothetical protein PJ15_2620 [Acinetobacter sp. neg1]|uniref:P-loop NTPase fold protein n=1 Tax=Acinetobacter sp. neg1 TaxID=1561068 RepID=UPI000543EFD5|nr:P-loop NTPase fold protein [Acinetobacter sp. neg1]KHF76915.1 hypothetical protein PJ15_2620 [Acinetobacter sp. neg1]